MNSSRQHFPVFSDDQGGGQKDEVAGTTKPNRKPSAETPLRSLGASGNHE